MSTHADTVRRYWRSAEDRDWDAFAATLAPDVLYEVPQTGERVRGREAYLAFNQAYPGDWHLTLDRLVADEAGAVSWTSFAVDGETMTGLCFFTFDAEGRVHSVADFWPEPYDPPPGREHLVERP